jgi:hypothetical protein
METATIQKGISYVTNNFGEKTAMMFDLKNEAVKELMEDLLDTLSAADRINDPVVPFSEVRARIKAKL